MYQKKKRKYDVLDILRLLVEKVRILLNPNLLPMTQPTVSSQSVTAWGIKSEHYPSLELCKKLTEIGFPETAINYEQLKTDEEADFSIWYFAKSSAYNIYRCPSVMEMLDVIPREIMKNGFWRWYLSIQATDISYSVAFLFDWVPRWEYFARDTLPNALAEMWLWLKENKYIW